MPNNFLANINELQYYILFSKKKTDTVFTRLLVNLEDYLWYIYSLYEVPCRIPGADRRPV